MIHHSDRGSQYLSIRYTERMADAGVEPSVGSVGDSYDNALAETIIGLFKAEVIRHRGPWRNLDAVEYATLEWVDWFNHRRLLEPIGNVRRRSRRWRTIANGKRQPSRPDSNETVSGKIGAVHTLNAPVFRRQFCLWLECPIRSTDLGYNGP